MGNNPCREAKQMRLSQRRDFLIRVRCCRTRHYRVDDIIEVFGDLLVIGMEGGLRCEDCGGNEWLSASLELPTARERASMRVRELVRIETIRRPIWRDGR